MNDISFAIDKYLQRRVLAHELNHYTLLGISTIASDDEIKVAMKSAVVAWNASDRKSDPESAQAVAKLLKQAQLDLLNPTLKINYDKRLTARAPLSVKSVFPDENPFAPFDPSACLVGATVSDTFSNLIGNDEERWHDLQRQIPSLKQADSKPQKSMIQDSAPKLNLPEQVTVPKHTTSPKKGSGALRAEQLKRSRRFNQRLYIAGFSAVALFFLGYAGVRFGLNRYQVAQKGTSPRSNSDRVRQKNVPVHDALSNISAPEQPSGLPTLSREEVINDESVASPPPAVTAPIKAPAMATEPKDEPKPMEFKVASPLASPIDWNAAMTKAKAALESADFSTFHSQMERALALEANEEMKAKRARLDQLGQLYEIFVKSLNDSKSKLGAGQTINVGKNTINIVESNSTNLIVRIQGKNEKYPWDRLPQGIALAIAEKSLSSESPTDLAARAVYFSLSPTRNSLFANRIKEWFEKSLGKGEIRSDLPQAMSDTYE